MGTLPVSEKLGSYRQHFYNITQRCRQKQRGEHLDNQKTTRTLRQPEERDDIRNKEADIENRSKNNRDS